MKVQQFPPRRKWYAVFMDHKGKLRRLALLDNERASRTIARTVDDLLSLRISKDVAKPEVARAFEEMPEPIRRRLIAWDIVPAMKAAGCKPLAEHVKDWEAAMLARGNTAKHARTYAGRARRVIEGCRFNMLSDVSASKALEYIADLRKDSKDPDARDNAGNITKAGKTHRGMSATSYNSFLANTKGFFQWMARDGRAHMNPLAHLKTINTKADQRHTRRALAPEELRELLDRTGKAAERYGMAGDTRALLYRLAVETGLRANEIRSLTRASFDLEGKEPTVTIAAGYAKNRRQDSLPLRPATVDLLKAHLADKMPTAPAFKMPPDWEVIDMLRADLAEARTKWLESRQTPQEREEGAKSTFLAYQDAAGRFADFHAFRHTFISNLAAGGVHPKTAQQLARHSTIVLTMDHYSHMRREDLAAALNTLPNLSAPERQAQAATGTTGNCENIARSVSLGVSPDRIKTRIATQELARNLSDDARSQMAILPEKTPVFDPKTLKPPFGLEPKTCALQKRCSAN